MCTHFSKQQLSASLTMTQCDNKLQLWQVTKQPSRDSYKAVMNKRLKTICFACHAIFAVTAENLLLLPLPLHNFSLQISHLNANIPEISRYIDWQTIIVRLRQHDQNHHRKEFEAKSFDNV